VVHDNIPTDFTCNTVHEIFLQKNLKEGLGVCSVSELFVHLIQLFIITNHERTVSLLLLAEPVATMVVALVQYRPVTTAHTRVIFRLVPRVFAIVVHAKLKP